MLGSTAHRSRRLAVGGGDTAETVGGGNDGGNDGDCGWMGALLAARLSNDNWLLAYDNGELKEMQRQQLLAD